MTFYAMELTGSGALVTGGTEGIGYAIAEALGGAGARVVVCSRTSSKVTAAVEQLRGAGYAAVGTTCDVADEGSVGALAKFVEGEIGTPDVVVNNAGIAHWGEVETMTTRQFDETVAVNLRGVFLVTRAFLPGMRRRGSGHFVNIASLAGRNPVPEAAAYAATKHAVLGFSKSLLMEVRMDGIKVTAVCPGTVVTPFIAKSGVSVEGAERKLQPGDVAEAVLAAVRLPDRALISELDLRPANP